MRILLIMGMILLSGTAFAAGFDDPWNDKTEGFDDPWKEQGNENPYKDSESAEQPVQQPQTQQQQPQTTVPRNQGMPKMPSAPSMPKFSQGPNVRQGAMSNALPDAAKKLYNQENRPAPGIIPQGQGAGADMNSVKRSLIGSGFTYGGKCGDGDIYFIEPALSCAAVAVRGDSRGLVGAGTWVSQKCYEKNPFVFGIAMDFASKGKKTGGGWENTVNYNGFMGCVEQGGTGHITDLPPFLGLVRPTMTKEVVDALLVKDGAKVVRTYKNGVEYQHLGATIFHEFCVGDGRMIRLALRVDKENPELRRRLDDMDLIKSGARYGDVLVRTESSRGAVTKIQWQNDMAEKRCKSGKV